MTKTARNVRVKICERNGIPVQRNCNDFSGNVLGGWLSSLFMITGTCTTERGRYPIIWRPRMGRFPTLKSKSSV